MKEARTAGRINGILVASGTWHDIDFARLEILKLLAEFDRVRIRVFEDYENLDALAEADFLVSYTCNVVPSLAAQEGLRDWVENGGRWYALHGTNAIIRLMADGIFETPDWAPLFIDTLGSMFRSHPPIEPYTVSVADPQHPLVAGLEDFQATDEQYLMHTYGDLKVLLETEFGGDAPGFRDDNWPQGKHPVFYIKEQGQGAVLYLTLGHCRHHYDMQPLMDYWPSIERCAWDTPEFYELLRRGLAWAMEPVEQASLAAAAEARENAPEI